LEASGSATEPSDLFNIVLLDSIEGCLLRGRAASKRRLGFGPCKGKPLPCARRSCLAFWLGRTP
jgi:hypothetical protein